MQETDKVSVIIPVYNVAPFLKTCINSVISQTHKNLEILCINDGSTDNCLEILKEFEAIDERITVISQKNMGLSEARNTGIDKATGKYIFFLDSDDFIHHQAIEILYRAVAKSRLEIAGFTFQKTMTDDVKMREYNIETIEYLIHKNPLEILLGSSSPICIPVWSKIYKTELVKQNKFIKGICFEDWPFTTCIMSKVKYFALANMPLYFYRVNNASISRTGLTEKKIEDYIAGIQHVYDYFKDFNNGEYLELVQEARIAKTMRIMMRSIGRSPKETQSRLKEKVKTELNKLKKNKVITYKKLTIFKKIELFLLLNS